MLSSIPTVEYIVKCAEPYTPTMAKDAAGYAVRTAETVAKSAYETGESVAKSAYETGTYAGQKVSEVVEAGRGVLTSMTPDPVMALLSASMETAAAVRADPVGSVKSYVPEFVIHGIYIYILM
jgi:hypothetical protein